jgi:outer membrane protein OmpA-like peptidoglycan-associated protein
MIVSSPSRAIGAAVLAGGLMLGGCSSEKDVPPTVASAPSGGTQANTDTGSGGTFPDVNSVPNQRPSSTIQDLNKAPEGLSGASGGGQYGGALVGGPTSSAQPPAPPPPPAPEQQLPPIAEDQTQNSTIPSAPAPAEPATAEPAAEAPAAAAAPAPEEAPAPSAQEAAAPEESPAASSQPIATPEIKEPEPMEPAEGEPQYGEAAPPPEPAAPAPQDQASQGQTVEAQAPQTQPTEPAADATPAAPAALPESTPPAQPETQVAAAPADAPAAAPSAMAQPQAAPAANGPSYPASSPEAYGITPPNPASPPYNPAGNSGGANYAAAAPAPPYATHGEPIGLIYFGEGSYTLSADDRDVLVQIANMQRSYGGVVHVVGHASMATGAAEANQRISAARAQAVADQLMQYGVPREAIQVIAAGDAQPLYSETAPSGEAGNRRADVYLGAY